MKYLTVALLSMLSLSAFAANINDTVARIEFEENAKCVRTGQSRFNFCTGGIGAGDSRYNTCFYTAKFDCVSNAGDFELKLKVKESYNFDTQKREARVRKVIIKR